MKINPFKTPKPRRLARLTIAPTILVALLQEGTIQRYAIIEHGLPKDAEIINAAMNMIGSIEVLIESKEFAPIPNGGEIPQLPAPIASINI